MKKSIRKIFCVVLVLSFLCLHFTPKAGAEMSEADKQMRAFLMSKCSDGLTNGERICGSNFDADNTETWTVDKEQLKTYLNGSSEYSPYFGVNFHEIFDGYSINNMFTYYDSVEYEDGSMIAADGFDFLPLGGTMQFVGYKYDFYLIMNCIFDSVTLTDAFSGEMQASVKKLNVHDENINISVYSNCDEHIGFKYNTVGETPVLSAYYNKKFENVNSFIGWYSRENGELYSTENELDLYKVNAGGITMLEARFDDETTYTFNQRGDINGDKIINTGDAVVTLKNCACEEYIVYEDYAANDANADGYINTADAVQILCICAGK